MNTVDELLKRAQAETALHEKLYKVAVDLEQEFPGEVLSYLNQMSDEDFEEIISAAYGSSEEGEGQGENSQEQESTYYDEEGQGEEQEAKAAADMAALAEVDALSAYMGARTMDAMVKRASEYGIHIQSDEVAALDEMLTAMGEKIAEQILVNIAPSAGDDEVVMDEKLAQDLYDMGRYAAIGRLFLEELSQNDSDA